MLKAHKIIAYIAIAITPLILIGCPAVGSIDTRFFSVPEKIVEVDEYPVYVQILKINDSIYDVQAGDGRVIGFTGLNEPLAQQDRWKRGADVVFSEYLGRNKKYKTVKEFPAPEPTKMFIRYEVEGELKN